MANWQARDTIKEADEIIIRNKKIPRPIVQILFNRGYDTPEKIEKFFAPSLNELHNPFLLNDMKKAVQRIIQAIQNRERMLIHGDYDTDGITSSALLIRNLRKFGLEVEHYLPNRMVEGYGLSKAGIDKAIKHHCGLVISVDCGISAVDEIRYALQHNIDVIVCDHHKPKDKLPPAYALVNPKLSGDYPFKELAGVGVAYKLLTALYTELGQNPSSLHKDLDLVALGTVVDVVPLVDENRVMVKYGMEMISKSEKPGFRALVQETNLNQINAYAIGFILGPRINACGRLYDAEKSLRLFLTEDLLEASRIAQRLSEDNQTRQNIERSIYEQAKTLIKERGIEERVVVLGKPGWHEGVVGIVASRLSDEYYRPFIVLSIKDELAKGSARSISGFDITEAIGSCARLLLRYGGHSQAAGLEMEAKNIPEFIQEINRYAQKFDEELFQRTRVYDINLDLNEITDDLVFFLRYFDPIGLGNPQPLFFGEDFEIVGVPRIVGQNHLKFALRKNGCVFPAIAYDQAGEILKIEVGRTRINCLFTIAEDSYSQKTKIILKVKNMKKLNN